VRLPLVPVTLTR
jgi:hypothetical protein